MESNVITPVILVVREAIFEEKMFKLKLNHNIQLIMLKPKKSSQTDGRSSAVALKRTSMG